MNQLEHTQAKRCVEYSGVLRCTGFTRRLLESRRCVERLWLAGVVAEQFECWQGASFLTSDEELLS